MSLELDAESLTLRQRGAPERTIPLSTVRGFTVRPLTPVQAGAVSEPDAELWLGYGEKEVARLPIPREALQVQLFLLRLAQLRPAADLRALPFSAARKRLQRRTARATWVLAGAAALAAALILLLIFRRSLGAQVP